MLPFAVVEFLDGGGVSVIPCKWFTGPAEDSRFWPPGRVNINKAVKDGATPEADWPRYRVRILGKAGKKYSCLLLVKFITLKTEKRKFFINPLTFCSCVYVKNIYRKLQKCQRETA